MVRWLSTLLSRPSRLTLVGCWCLLSTGSTCSSSLLSIVLIDQGNKGNKGKENERVSGLQQRFKGWRER